MKSSSNLDVGLDVPTMVAVGTLPFKGVKVYDERAEIRRELRLPLSKGSAEVHFFRFPSNVDRDTIRVEPRGKHSVRYSVLDDKEEKIMKETEVRKMYKETKKMKRARVEKELAGKILKTEREMWEKSADKVGCNEATGVADVGTLKSLTSALNTEGKKLITAEVKSMAEGAKISSKLMKKEKELSDLNNCTIRLIVHLTVKEGSNVDLEIIYYVNASSWTAAYDARLNTETKKLTINYFAVVKQRSGEDWTDTKLTVATGSGGAGKMPLQRGLFVVKKMNPDEEGYKIPERSINLNYDIPGKKKVTSNGAEHKILITDIELDPDIQYFVIPKDTLAAFIKARAVLKSGYTLLPGPVSVYRDSLFMSKSDMKRFVCPKEDFMCALGPEPTVRVEYSSTETRTTIKDKTRVMTETHANVKNKGKERLRLTVLEQVPISRDTSKDGVKVAVLKPSLEATARPDKDVKLNRFNYIEWTLELKPDESKTMDAKFALEYPAFEDIVYK